MSSYHSSFMRIKTIAWQDALPIRHTVLWPDKAIEFCKVEGDEHANHYGAFVDQTLVCVASIYIKESCDGRTARLRKFATLPQYQGQGVGSKVIEHAITKLKAEQVLRFWCDARTSALGFYQRFGLEVEGDEFDKSGVKYFKMSVEL